MDSIKEKYTHWKTRIAQYKPENIEALYQEYQQLFQGLPAPIAWMPEDKEFSTSNLSKAWRDLNQSNYAGLFSFAAANRAKFWEYTIRTLGIKLKTPYSEILDLHEGAEHPVWLKGAKLNITETCFSHNPNKIAILETDEETEDTREITYGELARQADRFGSGLIEKGFTPGDRIIFYVPFCTKAVIAYLGAIRHGFVPVSVADSFSPEELAKRIETTAAKVILTASGYVYGGKYLNIYSKVKQAGSIPAIVLKKDEDALREGDWDFDSFKGPETGRYHYSDPDYTTNILFSSGTTKEPKAIPWTQLTPVKAASDGYYHLDIRSEDTVGWTTGMGWMMAPWLIYASQLNGASMALYVGATTSEKFGKFVGEAGITILGTIPSVVRAWRSKGFHLKYNWKVRIFSSTGEPSNAEDYFYLMSLGQFKAPVIEYCGGTEIGGAYITGSVLQPASPATFTTPALGLDICILKNNRDSAKPGEAGEVFIIPPSIGLTQKLLNKDHHEEYFASTPRGPKGELLRRHGDALEKITEEGFTFYRSVGRTDDAMNLGGIKISAVEIESVLNLHPRIAETAAVGITENGGGPEKLIVFLVPQHPVEDKTILKKELQKLLTTHLNPLFHIYEIEPIEQIPRTASNKMMRRELKKMWMDKNQS